MIIFSNISIDVVFKESQAIPKGRYVDPNSAYHKLILCWIKDKESLYIKDRLIDYLSQNNTKSVSLVKIGGKELQSTHPLKDRIFSSEQEIREFFISHDMSTLVSDSTRKQVENTDLGI